MGNFTTGLRLFLILGFIISCSSKRTRRDNFIYSAANGAAIPTLSKEPPKNTFLADSPWPMTHRNPYAQASSPYVGPQSESDFSPRISDQAPPVSVTLSISSRYSSGKHAIWGYATGEVFVIDSDTWKVANRLRVTPKSDDDEKAALSGAYHLVDNENNFFVPYGQTIGKFSDPEESFAITKLGEFTMPSPIPNEMIVGMSLAFDGHIVFVTNLGRVGYIDRNFDQYYEVFIEQHNADISNSIAIDEEGGIFVLTGRAIHKIQIETNAGISHQWAVAYQSSSEPTDGRLGSGSGTTPTLMGHGAGQDKFVVFADGQNLMNLVLVWRGEVPENWQGKNGQDPRIAATTPITFVPHDERSSVDMNQLTSVTEQSILVRGYDAVVVSNKYGKPNPIMKRVVKFVSEKMGRKLSPGGRVVALSNHKAVSPKGVEKFSWDTNGKTLSSAWANDQISCPNGIPSMSEATGLMYCVGANGPSSFIWGSNWTFEGVDWSTGERAFSYPIGDKFIYNSFYAGTQIGLNGGLLTGIVGGALSSK